MSTAPIRNRRRRATAALAGLLWLAACGEDRPPGVERVGVNGTTRLVDLLDTAGVDGPLVDVDAVTDAAMLTDAPRTPLLFEDFEADEWQDSPRVAPTDRGRSLIAQRGDITRWTYPARPDTWYVLERWIRAPSTPKADLVVYERAAHETTAAAGARSPAAEFAALRHRALRLHWPSRGSGDGEWQRGHVAFVTTSRTTSIEVGLRARELGIDAIEDVRIDDVRLWRLDPTPQQVVGLLKARDVATDTTDHLGAHKRGRFPPQGDPKVMGPGQDNYSCRDALYAPADTDLTFPLRLDTEARLVFSTCLWRHSSPGDAATFEVIARNGSDQEVLWSRELAAEEESWHWHEGEVDLSAWRGRAFDLVLRTRAVRGHPHPLWGSPVLTAPPADDEVQNVILIAVDTLRADRLGCYGHGRATSPRLDALAKDGIRFDQVASNATWTCPSFASILTGTAVGRHRVWDWGSRTPLPQRLDTLAERFRAEGWSTHGIAFKSPLYDAGFDQGYDVSFNVPAAVPRADDNLARALDWLDSSENRRNFLFLHFDDPHQPFNQPAAFEGRFGDPPRAHGLEMPLRFESLRESGDTKDLRRLMRDLYDGEIAYVDDRIGTFLDALAERGLYRDAVIAFVSDHGEQLWEHGSFGHGSDMLHDEVVRVPLIIKPDSRGPWARGSVVASQVQAFDVMPTLLELAGLPATGDFDAVSLVPMLRPDAPRPGRRIAVIDAWSHRAIATRTQRWKYVLRFRRPGTTETLYDLQRDPGETVDVAARHPEALQIMRAGALDYAMTHQPGLYLVVLGEPGEAEHSSTVLGLTWVVALGGLPPILREPGQLEMAGTTTGPVVAAWQVRTDQGVRIGNGPALPPRLYRSGDLAGLIAAGETGPFLFECSSPADNPPAERLSEDLEQLEAMRVLGYIGAGKKGVRDR